jgi:hypothetical protein
MEIKVIIAAHKFCCIPETGCYLPLHVGRAGIEDIGFKGDDTGENISARNDMYSELTGLYWAWKNMDCDYLGLVHYRRYFCGKDKKLFLPDEDLRELAKTGDVFVPKKPLLYFDAQISLFRLPF